MKALTRKPVFWIAYALLSAAALAVAIHLFPRAIPLVNLDVRMNRVEAIAAGEALAVRYKLAPADTRSAARFDHDGTAQNYIELEGGGRTAFAELTRGDVYSPYWWSVRVFAPGTIEEAVMRFRADGAPDGFVRRLPESYVRDEATKALARGGSADACRGARTRRLERRLRALHAARPIAGHAAERPGRPHVRLRAAGEVRRGARSPAARGRRRRARRRRALHVRSRVVRPPLPGVAQREQPDRRRGERDGGPAVRRRRLHLRLAVADAPALARLAAGVRRRPDRRGRCSRSRSSRPRPPRGSPPTPPKRRPLSG